MDAEIGGAKIAFGRSVDGGTMLFQPGDGRQRQAGEGTPSAQCSNAFDRAIRLPVGDDLLAALVQPGDHRINRITRQIAGDDRSGLSRQC